MPRDEGIQVSDEPPAIEAGVLSSDNIDPHFVTAPGSV
jgi:hypothetical protein